MRQVLPSGVRVIVLRDRSAPVVAAHALWSGGSRREPADLRGVSQVLAATWTAGCGSLDPDALASALDADAASMSGVAGRDTVGLRAEWTRAGWEQGFDLLADCASTPHFAPTAVAQARQRARRLARERAASSTWVAVELLAGVLDPRAAGVEPEARDRDPGAPEVDPLDRIDHRQVLDHFRTHYPVSAMTLAVVGDVDPDRVVARARERFGESPRRRPPPIAPFAASPPAERELYRHIDGDGVATVAIGFAAIGRAHPDRAALEVAAGLIGGEAAMASGADSGALVLRRSCRPSDVPGALAALRGAVDRLRDPGPGAAEVARVAARLASARRDALTRAPRAAALLALYEVLGPGSEHAARHAERLAAVTVTEVRAAAERYLRPDAAVVATALPLLASPEAARRMRGVRPAGRAAPAKRARPERKREAPRKRRRR
jgi:zinc protease